MAPNLHATHVRINDTDPAARRDLSDRNLMHKRVMSMFRHTPSDTFRQDVNILWRIDNHVDGLYLFVTALELPDTDRLPDGWGHPWGVYEYGDHLANIQEGDLVHFEITANPTRVKTTPRGKTREVLAGQDARDWWARRAEQAGLAVRDVQMTDNPLDAIARYDTTFNLAVTDFTGTATVTNTQPLQEAAVEGIGRGKAYGLGMLTITRT